MRMLLCFILSSPAFAIDASRLQQELESLRNNLYLDSVNKQIAPVATKKEDATSNDFKSRRKKFVESISQNEDDINDEIVDLDKKYFSDAIKLKASAPNRNKPITPKKIYKKSNSKLKKSEKVIDPLI
jgi:hypothetical protein